MVYSSVSLLEPEILCSWVIGFSPEISGIFSFGKPDICETVQVSDLSLCPEAFKSRNVIPHSCKVSSIVKKSANEILFSVGVQY